MRLSEELSRENALIQEHGAWRRLHAVECLDGGLARFNGKVYKNFSGNDYLGIAGDTGLRRQFYAQYGDSGDPALGLSAASSRLLTGNHASYAVLEEALSALYGGRPALVFNSGYHANIGILPALAGRDDLILSDKLNHASLIDGMRLSEATFRRYPHLDYAYVEEELRQRRAAHRRVFLVSESVFSMDGDTADLRELVRLKEQYDAILLLDEAHAVGVFGEQGAGLAAEQGVAGRVDILVGTLGKAFGAAGAYAVMDDAVRDYLINRMRPLIFTTALPPVVVSWGAFAVRQASGMASARRHVQNCATRLRAILGGGGAAGGPSVSQIVPLLAGENAAALALAEKFQAGGILVFPIRHPTVPQGTARLRFSLSAALTLADIEAIGGIL